MTALATGRQATLSRKEPQSDGKAVWDYSDSVSAVVNRWDEKVDPRSRMALS
jgi:hypothetical protein